MVMILVRGYRCRSIELLSVAWVAEAIRRAPRDADEDPKSHQTSA